MTHIEKVQYAAKPDSAGAFDLLSRFLFIFFAATVFLAPSGPALGQQTAETSAQAQDAIKARAAETTMSQKATTRNQLTAVPLETVTKNAAAAIRPFRITIPKTALVDLRRRIAATRWPDKETVTDQSQGVQLAKLQPLVEYWGTEYDWRKAEAKLNALPQFVTNIDGVGIQYVHVRSRHPNALPLIMTHGWPGSIFELLKVIGPLTDPTAYGGRAEDAFDLVLPSIPGYGFSGKPQDTNWTPLQIASAWDTLMKRLGIHALRVSGRRLGRDHLGGDGGAGANGAAGHPHQHAWDRAAKCRESRPHSPAGALRVLRCGEGRVRIARRFLQSGLWLRRNDEHQAADARLRTCGFAGGHGCLLLR